MPFEKGNKLQVPRKRPNKDKRRFKVALQEMFEDNADKIAGWLEEIAKEDPQEAMNQLNKWAEYCYPKLARTEQTGIDGNPVQEKVVYIDNKEKQDLESHINQTINED